MNLWPPVLTALFIVLWLVCHPAKANELCPAWAEMVESLEQMDADVRAEQLKAWREMTSSGTETQRYVMSAVNWLEQGNTSEAAWQECESF